MDPRNKSEDDICCALGAPLNAVRVILLAMPPPSPFLALTVLATTLLAGGAGGLGLAMPAAAQATALSKEQSAAVAAYDKALREFKAILTQRRAQLGNIAFLERLTLFECLSRGQAAALNAAQGTSNRYKTTPERGSPRSEDVSASRLIP